MYLLPIVYNNNWNSTRPSGILNRHFGLGWDPNDLLLPVSYTVVRCPTGYCRPWRSAVAKGDSGSTVTVSKDKFQVNLDVQHFKPGEITVKISGNNTITVEGKHEEKRDEHGFVYRHFVRRYVLPDGHDINNVVPSLSSDGVLSITAPRIGDTNEKERTIPVQQTGVPSKPIESKKEDEAGQNKEDQIDQKKEDQADQKKQDQAEQKKD